jgi:alkanesulfonate monooxygenase SsuD/methylene tetrahydromethanopterin reductase-like flavin-dependent oxidoreductase (luciferase family)
MRIGVKPGQIGLSTGELRRSWREAEDAGFESVWTFDHLTGPPDARCYEATALLAAMAVLTERVRIGCLVLANGTRRIETLAATLGTIDALSGGRLEVGLGAASQFARQDFDTLGIPFPGWPQRISGYRLAVDRLLELTGPGSPIASRPVQSPVPLILGGSAAAIRRLAIERGLAWNSSTDSVDEFRRLSEGQPDPQAQVFMSDVPSVEETIAAFSEAGATRLVFVLQPPIEPGAITELARRAGL